MMAGDWVLFCTRWICMTRVAHECDTRCGRRLNASLQKLLLSKIHKNATNQGDDEHQNGSHMDTSAHITYESLYLLGMLGVFFQYLLSHFFAVEDMAKVKLNPVLDEDFICRKYFDTKIDIQK
jgi:hypothetical protein